MAGGYLTTQDLQNKYKVGRGTIDKWRKKDGMPYMKIGRTIRFEEAKVEQWVKAQDRASKSR